MIKITRFNSIRAKNVSIGLFLIAAITFSSVSGFIANIIHSPDNDELDNDELLNDFMNSIEQRGTDLSLNISTSSLETKGDDNRNQNIDELEFLNLTSDPIEENKPFTIKDAYLLVREIAKKDGLLFYDMFNCMSSDPLDIKYSDEVTYLSELGDPEFGPLSGIPVTYLIYQYLDSYPEWVAEDPSLYGVYDYIWFYLYYYESLGIIDNFNRGAVGSWLLSIKDSILDSIWVEEIDADITNDDGISAVSQDAYYLPGTYNIITMANIDLFAKFNNGKSVIDSFYMNPYPKPYNRMKNTDFFLFRTFYDHLTVEKEITKIEPIQLYEINNTDDLLISAQLLDDEGNGIPQPEDLDQNGRTLSFYIQVDNEWVLIDSDTTDPEGWCQIITSFLLPYGIYLFKVIFYGDEYYLSSEKFGLIEINREQTILRELDNVNVQTTDYVTLSAKLTDNELNPIGNKPISFSILLGGDWCDLGTSYTNEEGLVEFNWQVTTEPGTYMIKAKFYQDDYFVGSKAYAVATIEKEDTKIIISTMISDTHGKYDIIARLVEDDPQQVPIPDKEIDFRVNGWEPSQYTDENGIAKVSISLNTFDDISIEAEYDGSIYFHPSSEEHVKNFDEEWDFFNSYSDDMLIDLFEDYSDLSGSIIPNVAGSFFNFKQDLLDGSLSTGDDLQHIFDLSGYSYDVVLLGGNEVELQDFLYFPDTITGGDGIVTLSWGGMSFDIPWNPIALGDIPNVDDIYEFFHTFEWEDWLDKDISQDELFDLLGVDDIDEFIDYIKDWIGSIFEGDFTKWLNDELYVTFEIEFDIFDIPPWDTADEVKNWLEDFVKDVELPITLTIADFALDEWDNNRGDLFWEWIGDTLNLGFKYMDQFFEDILNNIIDILAFLGIDLWELLQDIFGNLLEDKAEALKEEFEDFLEDNQDDIIADVLAAEIMGDSTEVPDILNELPGNDFGDAIDFLYPLNPDDIELNPGDSWEDLIDNIGSVMGLFSFLGKDLDSEDMMDWYDDLNEDLEDDYWPYIAGDVSQIISNIPLTIDMDDLNAVFSNSYDIMDDWEDIGDMKYSDILDLSDFSLNDIFLNLDNDILDSSMLNLLTLLIDEDVIEEIAESVIDFAAEYFWWGNDFEVWLSFSWLLLLAIQLMCDALDGAGIADQTRADDLILIGLAIAMGVCAMIAKTHANNPLQKRMVDHFIGAAEDIIFSTLIEIWLEEGQSEIAGDIISSILEIHFAVTGVPETWENFEDYGFWVQLYWVFADVSLGISNSAWIWGYKFTNWYLVAASGIGQGVSFVMYYYAIQTYG